MNTTPRVSQAPRTARKTLASITAVLSLAACAGTSTLTPVPPSEVLEVYVAEAQASGADESQIAVLERAREEGRYVTFEEYTQAISATMSCMTDLGYSVESTEVEKLGYREVLFVFGTSAGVDDDTGAMRDYGDCQRTWSDWIEVSNAANVDEAKRDAIYERFRPAMIQCLIDNGVDIPGDATIFEALNMNYVVLPERDGPNAVDCVAETGLIAFL